MKPFPEADAGKLADCELYSSRMYDGALCNQYEMEHLPMTIWFVSRHPGALEWARKQCLHIDKWSPHIEPAEINPGDTVIGSLPVNLAADVCERGAIYINLTLDLPLSWRGRELIPAEMEQARVRLVQFHVEEQK